VHLNLLSDLLVLKVGHWHHSLHTQVRNNLKSSAVFTVHRFSSLGYLSVVRVVERFRFFEFAHFENLSLLLLRDLFGFSLKFDVLGILKIVFVRRIV